jgi:RND family efflux transporter MFP subunit
MEAERQERAPQRRSVLFLALMFVVIVLVVVGVFTLFQRKSQYEALAKETEKMAIPTVAVIHPTQEGSSEDLVLPGAMQAYMESAIYARTNGYLKKWYHDIGSRVREGDILADIETPEVDQQLAQARADMKTAQANANLSKITATRYEELIKTDGVSKQEVDNAVGDYAAKEASLASAEANVRRLEELESFKHVYAPFSGVVTRRNVDVGNLINAGNGGASQQLFYLSQTDPLRVYVNVPEMYAASTRPGLGAYLELTQYPGRRFEGKVVRTADAIDPGTRTLLTEVAVPNRSGELLPGGYAQVHLEMNVNQVRLQVPINALLFRAEGLRAVTVSPDHKTHLQAIAVGRDYGTSLEVLNGLKPDDWIVVNPADSLAENEQVNVKQVPQMAAPGPQQGTRPAGGSPNGGASSGQAGGGRNTRTPPIGNKQ